MRGLRRPKRRSARGKRAISPGAGLRATGTGLRVTGERLRDAGAAVLGPLGSGTARAGDRAAGRASGFVEALAERFARLVDAAWGAAERVRPRPVLFAVAAISATVLGLAQFADFRIVRAVTQDLDRTSAGEAHAYALLPVAVLAMVALYLAATGRRPRVARGFAALGAVAIAVTLAVDLPQGGSREGFELRYDGVDARLAGGFFAQLAAGVAMLATGTLLARSAPPARRPG